MQLLALLAAASAVSAGAALNTRFSLSGYKYCTGYVSDDGNCAKIYNAKAACCGDDMTSPGGIYKSRMEVVAPAHAGSWVCGEHTGKFYCVKP